MFDPPSHSRARAGSKARSIDPNRIRPPDRFETLLGPVGFDPKGDITAPGYGLHVWRSGAYDHADRA